MSFSETVFLFFLALIIFGPKKLPEIARQAGKLLNEFRRASNEFKAQIEQEIAHIEVEEKRKTILPPSPPVEGSASRTLSGASSTPVYSGSYPATESAKSSEIAAGAASAASAVSAEPPVPGNGSAPTEEQPPTETVAPSPSQESHV